MKLSIALILFLLLLPTVLAQESNLNIYSNLTINLNVDGNFSIVSTDSNSKIEEVKTYLTFIPQNDILQKVKSKEYYASPLAKTAETTKEVLYEWNNPIIGEYNFGVDSTILVKNAIVIVDEKVKFPLEEQNIGYTEPTEFIDITPEIKDLAESLANGEDDLYVVSTKVAEWVEKNIQYDLTTITADVVQKSSWVLEHRAGVCDELTNLFISMMRSLGVPARFVSGVAYTNQGNKWGPHGWAEVYFPDKGWVPFDVTYKQFGWIDPTHIKLKVSEDSGDSTVRYTWASHNAKLEGKEISLSASLISHGEKVSPFQFSIKPLVNNVGPGSFVPIEVEINNDKNYYFPLTFIVTKSTELTENNVKSALAKPLENKKVFWITKIPTNIDENYVYRTFIEIKDNFNTNKSTVITYSKNLPIISIEEAEELIKDAEKNKDKQISNKIELDCRGPRYIFSYEEARISCDIKNKGILNLENIDTCYNLNCQKINNLKVNEENNITFTLNLEPGIQNLEFITKNEGNTVSDIVSVKVLEDPDLQIVNIEYPESIDYDQSFNISLTLSVGAPVRDINLRINKANALSIQELDSSKTAVIITKGKDFLNSKEILIDVSFKDKNNKNYNRELNYPLEVKNVPWYIKVLIFFKLI